jgi:hypothetical protein
MKKPKPLTRWRINLTCKKGERLGVAKAPDAESAIEAAVEQFGVDPAHRSRWAAQRITERHDRSASVSHRRPIVAWSGIRLVERSVCFDRFQ